MIKRVVGYHWLSVYVEGRRSQNMTATFCDFTPAEIPSVHTNGSSAIGKIPNLRLRLGGRDGWRDAEERGEGMGRREKEGRGDHSSWLLFFLSLSLVAVSVSPI